MPYTDHFLKKDKQKALQYRKDWSDNLRLAEQYVNQGDLDKANMHASHALHLLGELRVMNIQHLNNKKMLSDHALQMRRDWY